MKTITALLCLSLSACAVFDSPPGTQIQGTWLPTETAAFEIDWKQIHRNNVADHCPTQKNVADCLMELCQRKTAAYLMSCSKRTSINTLTVYSPLSVQDAKVTWSINRFGNARTDCIGRTETIWRHYDCHRRGFTHEETK